MALAFRASPNPGNKRGLQTQLKLKKISFLSLLERAIFFPTFFFFSSIHQNPRPLFLSQTASPPKGGKTPPH